MDFSYSQVQAHNKLKGLMAYLSISDHNLKQEAEEIIRAMLQHNKNLNPDMLARAAFYLAKRKYYSISRADIKKIRNNGGREDTSWINLIPVIERVVEYI